MKISQVIKENRVSRELTQEELATSLNVSRSTISSWENGRSYPDLEMVLILSQEFDISVDSLLKGDSDIVQEISKDTKVKKRNRIVISMMTVVLLILMVFIFNTKFKARSVGQSDILSTERDGEKVVITLKKSLFYKNVAYNVQSDEDQKTVEIMMSRVFAPFSSVSNIVEINPDFLKGTKNKPIVMVDNNLEPVYEIK